ncbi:hypothetical protein BV20DRAFT_973677 [Pilatotrama ljubarskyi]|nr:hypothetical protein BV20DRAFT_973677 [Pilatotrama ljubarskyi]
MRLPHAAGSTCQAASRRLGHLAHPPIYQEFSPRSARATVALLFIRSWSAPCPLVARNLCPSTMSDTGYNIWGVVAGAIGTLGLLPLLFAWLPSQMPSAKLRVLLEIMGETDALFRKALEDGILTSEDDLHKFYSGIWALNVRVDDVRVKVYGLDTWQDEFGAWWRGLSRKITLLCRDVNKIRTKLAESSFRDRKRLTAEGFTASLARFAGALGRERLSSVTSFGDADGLTATVDASQPASPTGESATGGIQTPWGSKLSTLLPGTTPPQTAQPPVSIVALPADMSEPGILSGADTLEDMPRFVKDSTQSGDKRRKHRSTRQDVLRRFGEQLCVPGLLPLRNNRELSQRRQNYGRGRLKAFAGLLRGDGRAGLAHTLRRATQLIERDLASPARELYYHEEYDGDDESDDSMV